MWKKIAIVAGAIAIAVLGIIVGWVYALRSDHRSMYMEPTFQVSGSSALVLVHCSFKVSGKGSLVYPMNIFHANCTGDGCAIVSAVVEPCFGMFKTDAGYGTIKEFTSSDLVFTDGLALARLTGGMYDVGTVHVDLRNQAVRATVETSETAGTIMSDRIELEGVRGESMSCPTPSFGDSLQALWYRLPFMH